ncbi:rhomboid family intramembrane serine protease [Hymenobacter guriensis]|uniref:Rhomboid family intramembrane serine protease n=1 Tax=Hymenobacter guriensis TaxID=2793065 RepID=A0ABS0L1C1_9BACT|nr:rhomboid family intramembrane serine protease [Hymenobacter guriensis]MBG8553910.1 rhomboid family intramembrane serine protease [Hymenobacter guriensis]
MYQLKLLEPPQEIMTIWAPVALGGLLTFFFLRPRFKLLIPNKNDSWGTLFGMIATFGLVAPCLNLLEYLVASTGRLEALSSVEQLPRQPAARYYTLARYHISKQGAWAHPSITVSGKHNEHLDLAFYVSCPILSSVADTAQARPVAWLGTAFHQQISNRLSAEEKEREYQRFIERTTAEFDRRNLHDFTYLQQTDNDEARRGYRAAIAENPRRRGGPEPVVLLAVHEPFANRSADSLRWYWISTSIAAALFGFLLLFPSLNTDAILSFRAGERAPDETWQLLAGGLLPRKSFWVTPLLLDSNLLLYSIMALSGLGVVSFQGSDLLAWGASYGPAIRAGESWRLLTGAFLHGGLMHLANNVVALGFAGWVLEKAIGSGWLLVLYLLSALGASLAGVWWHEATISIGASGAIFGLYGFGLWLLLRRSVAVELRTLLVVNLFFMLTSLVLGFILPGVDNAGHLGGLLTGFLLGVVLFPLLRQRLSTYQE